MDEEHKGVALSLLGIVAVIAIVGLVLLVSKVNSAAGAATFAREAIGDCKEHVTNVVPAVSTVPRPVFTAEEFKLLQAKGMDCKLYKK